MVQRTSLQTNAAGTNDSTAATDPLQVSPAFASQLFMFMDQPSEVPLCFLPVAPDGAWEPHQQPALDSGCMSARNQPPESLPASTSHESTSAASSGFCDCVSARCQIKLPHLTPIAVQTIGSSHSSYAYACHQLNAVINLYCNMHAHRESEQPQESTPTFRIPTAACVSGSGSIFCH